MTISYNWLKEYIDIPESPDAIGAILTATGLEVENVAPFESVKGGLQGLVIGEVLTCVKHPNADKLSLTTVDIGSSKPISIVCGASNVATGQKVVVATVGTTIHPTKGEPFEIKSAKIRGEQSEGMICAEDEIGLGTSHEGIMVLNTSAKNGTPASEYFKIESDYVLEIGLTPNRVDASSHIGVARDIKASQKREIRLPSIEAFKADNQNLSITVQVDNSDACPRYSGVTLTNVTVAESPSWLKNRLLSIGQTPINSVVDITNYVLHETGQPLHAFDADAITGKKVIVKTLPAGSKFVTLDNKERELTATDLMICNEKAGMCIAGIFGGIQSGVTSKTKNIFLESAYFSADFIRKSSMHHGLKTDASFRFERGADPNNTVYALKRAALLIKEITGGQISSEVIDVYSKKIKNSLIEVKDKNVIRLIGKTIPRDEIFSILNSLDIQIIDKKGDRFTVSVPPYRVDVLQEADVIEEILRIYGFNNIELNDFVGSDFIAEFPEKDINKFKNTIGQMLVGAGFYEIITNSLTNIAYQEKNQLKFTGKPIEILNKLSEDQGILRQSMLFSGLEVCAYNINRKQKDLRLFEFGKIYYREGDLCEEEERLGLYMTGNVETENWQHKTQAVTYHDLTQQVAHIVQKSGVTSIKQEVIKDQLFDYALQLSANGKIICTLGKVKPPLAKDLGVRQEIFYAELNTTLLFRKANPKLVIQEVPKFPEVRRDLSLVLNKGVSFEEIKNMVLHTEKRLIKEIIAFDVYEGENIPAGKKAYALGFTLLDKNKTLTDEEIDKTMNRLIVAFEQTLGAVIRK